MFIRIIQEKVVTLHRLNAFRAISYSKGIILPQNLIKIDVSNIELNILSRSVTFIRTFFYSQQPSNMNDSFPPNFEGHNKYT
jgi:hypothetical protein